MVAVAGSGTLPTEGERLLRALNSLCEEHGHGAGGSWYDDAGRCEGWPPLSMLNRDDEQMVTALGAGLARLADAHGGEVGPASASLSWVLEGAQSAARNYLLCGRKGPLIELLPTFAYLVVLQVSGPSEARGVAERATELLD